MNEYLDLRQATGDFDFQLCTAYYPVKTDGSACLTGRVF